MSLVSRIEVGVTGTNAATHDLGINEFKPAISNIFNLANGTGANQANQIFADQRSLTATTSEDLDLSGALTDAFGATIIFAKIKAIIVSAASANDGSIEVGGAAANGFNSWVGATGDFVSVKAGGSFAIIAPDATGYAVTAGTGDLLKINNTGASAGTYDITIIGVE